LKLRFSDFFRDLTSWNKVSDERLGIVIWIV
jgi:hypothetical protein